MKALKYEHQSIFPLWGRVKLNFRDRYRKPHIYYKNSSHYQFFSSNSQKMSRWCKKKTLPNQMHLYSSHMVPHMIPQGIIIFQGVLTKFNFWRNFHIWKKIVNLMKALKYEHQSILPLWGRIKLNFRDRYRKPNIVLISPAAINFFHQILKNCHFGVKKIIPHPYGFVWPIYGPLYYSLGVLWLSKEY